MLLSSPRTRTLKVIHPVAVFGMCLLIFFAQRREKISTEPVTSFSLFVLVLVCVAWVVWRPWNLHIADHVEEQSTMLLIRRGGIEVLVPYSAVQSHEISSDRTNFRYQTHFPRAKRLGVNDWILPQRGRGSRRCKTARTPRTTWKGSFRNTDRVTQANPPLAILRNTFHEARSELSAASVRGADVSDRAGGKSRP